MAVTALEPVVSTSTESNFQQTGTLGKDDFLTLLVAQLRNQDPLEPMESTDFTAQLAQFSSLEQLENINKNLEVAQRYDASLNNSQAVSYIGKTIKALGNSLYLKNGADEDIRFVLADDSKTVYVNIYDSDGNFIRAIEKSGLGAGEHTITWDGTDSKGLKVPDGAYSLEVIAVDQEDGMVTTSTFSQGEVTGVTFDTGTPYLLIGDIKVAATNVISVSETE